MSDDLLQRLRAATDGVTPGKWVQFHPKYLAEAVGTKPTEWDSSHDISAIMSDGYRVQMLARFRHSSDALFAQKARTLIPEAADRIAALEAEVARLLDENSALAAWQCVFTDGRKGLVCDEYGGQYCAMERRAEKAEAEVARLRSVLGETFWDVCNIANAFQDEDYTGGLPGFNGQFVCFWAGSYRENMKYFDEVVAKIKAAYGSMPPAPAASAQQDNAALGDAKP